jgi:hypothetical protein
VLWTDTHSPQPRRVLRKQPTMIQPKATRGNIDVAINLMLDGVTILLAGVHLAGHHERDAA